MNTVSRNNRDDKNKRDDKKKRDDRKICIALMASFVILTVQYFILIYFNLIGTSLEPRIQLVSKILVGAAYLFALPVVFRRGNVSFIFIYTISALIFLINYMCFPANQMYLNELIVPLFLFNLPAFIYSLNLYNWTEFYAVMKKSSYIVFLIGVILGGLVITEKASIGTYSMSLSYYMLLPTVIFLNELLDGFSFKLMVLTVTSITIILAFGSRGAVLCVIVFVMIKILMSLIEKKKKRKIGDILLFSSGLLLFLNVQRILEYINYILFSFGIKSRSLSLLIRDDPHLSGRDLLYEKIITEIISHPLWGSGLAGDRYILGGRYVHNILLEIAIDFGFLAGLILLIILLAFILKALLNKDKSKSDMMILWLALGFIHLMVSSSYLTDFKFWIFLGILLSGISKKIKTEQIKMDGGFT